MATTTVTTPYPANFNNPTKEILASSGIWDDTPYAPTPFAPDIPNSIAPNTGINTTTTTTTTFNPMMGSGTDPFLGPISSGNLVIDDMLVFNKYIHYKNNNRVITFHPQTFLEQSIVTFNIYSLENR